MHATKEVKRGLSDPADALQRIDEVLRLSRSAIWEVDREGSYVYASASHEDLLGYRPEELVGIRKIHDFGSLERRAEPCGDWIGAGREFSNREVPLVTKDGRSIWVASHGTPIFDADGRVAGFRGTDTDITARKKAEEELRASEQALWRQIQEAPVPMAFTGGSNDGEFQVNRAFVRTFGYQPGEVPTIGVWFAKAYPDAAYREQVVRDTDAWLAQAARGEALQPREYRVTCKDGRVLDVEVAAAMLAGKFVGTFTDVTARRRELEQRKAVEENLRRVLDNLPFPVATSSAGTDFDWRDARAKVTYLNRRFTALFGYTLEDIPTVAEWARRSLPDEEKRHEVFAVLEQQVQAALRGEGDVGPVEVRVLSNDGEVRDVFLHAVAVGGQLVISLEDVSQWKRDQEKLRESEERFRLMIEKAPVAIAYTDRKSGRVHVNEAHEKLFGYRRDGGWMRDELAARMLGAEGAVVSDLVRWDKMRREARERGEPLHVATRLRAEDGTVREVELTSIALPGGNFNVIIDVTERDRVLRELRERGARLRAIVEHTPVPISYTLAGGTAVHLNKAFTETYGWTEEDVPTVEAWFEKAYPDPDYRSEVLATWGADVERARRADGNIGARLYRVMGKSGTLHEVEISAVVFEGEMFGSFVDLTERNRAEQKLREQREQLAHVGRVSALGQLAASLAHELDQPLGAILNNAEAAQMLLAQPSPNLAELGEIVRDILEDDRRAGAVLDRIRAMVQRQSFQSAEVDLPALCREVAALVQPAAAKKGIKLEFSCEPGLPPVEGDAVWLQQALLNLLINSFDAIGGRQDGRIEVRAGLSRPEEVEIAVTDNGGGVTESDYARLLEPFHTTKEDGLGMGLPIVHSIVEQHGGRLHIDNQPGRGLTIRFRLPCWRGPAN